jgi:hypothetical protein
VCFAKCGGGITFCRGKEETLQNHIPMREKRMSTGGDNFQTRQNKDVENVLLNTNTIKNKK